MSGLNDRLRHARLAAGYPTAKAAAQALGLAVATYTQHEADTRKAGSLDLSKIEAYARAFGCDPVWLAFGAETVATYVVLEEGEIMVPGNGRRV